jgi:hypothetical protein
LLKAWWSLMGRRQAFAAKGLRCMDAGEYAAVLATYYGYNA